MGQGQSQILLDVIESSPDSEIEADGLAAVERLKSYSLK